MRYLEDFEPGAAHQLKVAVQDGSVVMTGEVDYLFSRRPGQAPAGARVGA